MTDLNDLFAFVSVVRHGGFSLASKALEQPKSTLSRRVSQLEAHLGVSLLVRTTRSIRLTEAGQKFYADCSRIFMEMEAAEKNVAPHQNKAEGMIRMSAPFEVGAYVLPHVLKSFMEKYPDIQIELDLSDRYVDLLREGFDLALRAGVLQDSSIKAKKIGVGCFALFAAPSYLKENGTPKTPREVCDHRCVVFSPDFREFPWTISSHGKKEKLKPVSQIRVNSLTSARNLSMAGAGICYVPVNIAQEHVDNKELVRVLPDWEGDPKPYYVVYPPTKIQPLRVRLFIDYLHANLKL